MPAKAERRIELRVQSPWSIKNPNGDKPDEEEVHL
jgi:hypothetical protein